MSHWFARLSIHRKLVIVALVVTTAALVIATTGLLVLDLLRYRRTALEDTESLAQVIAENTAAAVTFDDVEAARDSLGTVRVRPTVYRSCLYLPDGTLFAAYARPDQLRCPAVWTANPAWRVVTGEAPVSRNGRLLGTVYVERDLSEIGARVAVAFFTGLGMLLIAGSVASLLASWLNRSVSAPIVQLASAARAIDPRNEDRALPRMEAGQDEVGDLVRAFTEMLRRVNDAQAQLVESNQLLTRQEAERAELLAREREASRLKDEFLAAVSHELRTPLNAIAGWVQILTTTGANEQTVAKAIASIARNAKAQTRVIEDLVDVSRIVTGKMSLRIEPVDLRDVSACAVDVTKSAAEAKQIRVTVNVPPGPCIVAGDRDRLQQVVWNLLSNAIKFTPAGGAVCLSVASDEDGCTVEVSDTGIGIPAAFLPFVFDRFRQADGSMTREHGGLGLGLAIVKELTERHGGAVSVSSPGQGSGATFTVRLPKGAVGPGPVFGTDVHDTESGQPAAGIRILVVDDNADALDVMAEALARRGARVRTASSGDEALREWDREPADVLICDLAMPHVDGFAVLSAIRERDRATGRTTPAIAVTAHAADEARTRTRAAGFDFHVSKPYDAATLERTVLAALERVGKQPGPDAQNRGPAWAAP